MKEKELRFALVCYGGVSLAVYMHGVTKEILKLVRASRDFHVFTNQPDSNAVYDAGLPKRGEPADSERAYFDLLREIGKSLDLRVVVDVIAGTSAGGINGVILARALAHDLNIDPLRDFWLKYADVTELMPNNVKARPWTKWYFRPFVWYLLWKFREDFLGNIEMKENASMFLRSRWFKPPFHGYALSKVLFDGFSAMGDPSAPGSSLVPGGLSLDLFVTMTDFYGYITETQIHDPPTVRDREHRTSLKMSYRHWPPGHETSSFERENLPALVFSARATSSFPGAFNPMQFKEIDRLLADRGLSWRTRADFLYQNFRPYLLGNLNPSDAAFIDGSVLNNKPFAQAINAIAGRPAYRHVDRRLLYIDPHPRGAENANWGRVPGFFETIKGALSDIPRNEPVHDDLTWVNNYNNEVRRLQTVIESARHHIKFIADSIAGPALDKKMTGAELGALREQANNRARTETGFAYEGYLRLKLGAVLEDVGRLVADICGHTRESKESLRIVSLIQHWAAQTGTLPTADELMKPQDHAGGMTRWVRFLLRFDIKYRQRRLRFVIRAVNQFYTRLQEPELAGLKSDALDRIKAGLYDALGALQPMSSMGVASGERRGSLTAATMEKVKRMVKALEQAKSVHPAEIARDYSSEMEQAAAALGDDLALENYNARSDALLISLLDGAGGEPLPAQVRRALIEHYIGFAVWDVLTFSITNWRDLDEFDEIRVDRLSPEDATTLRSGDAAATLKGVQFYHFGAFFSLAYRQNDYLWGRLHAAERLIDIVLDAARIEKADEGIDAKALKKKAFAAILNEEEKHLESCADQIAALKAELANI